MWPCTIPSRRPWTRICQSLTCDPGSVRAKAYDCVLNGYEIGGGSIRIYNTELQSKMFDLLACPRSRRKGALVLLEAFDYGTPPHGGLAFGLDRLSCCWRGRTTSATSRLPQGAKTQAELMSGAPDTGGRQPA